MHIASLDLKPVCDMKICLEMVEVGQLWTTLNGSTGRNRRLTLFLEATHIGRCMSATPHMKLCLHSELAVLKGCSRELAGATARHNSRLL